MGVLFHIRGMRTLGFDQQAELAQDAQRAVPSTARDEAFEDATRKPNNPPSPPDIVNLFIFRYFKTTKTNKGTQLYSWSSTLCPFLSQQTSISPATAFFTSVIPFLPFYALTSAKNRFCLGLLPCEHHNVYRATARPLSAQLRPSIY